MQETYKPKSNDMEGGNPNPEGIEKHKGFIENMRGKMNEITLYMFGGSLSFGSGLTLFAGGIIENNPNLDAAGIGVSIAGLLSIFESQRKRQNMEMNIHEKVEDVEYFEEIDTKDLTKNLPEN